MEPASLTVSIAALAGLFNNAVDCFEYVQLGRGFGTNFQTSLLKLDNARLRLSRWGQSVGLSGDLEDVQSLHGTLGSAKDVSKAEGVLGQILELFAAAEGVSTKFKGRAKPTNTNLLVYNTQNDLEHVMASLHAKMRELSIKRQNRTGLRHKAKWALYEEKHFRRLIEDVTDLINDLVELFPAAQAAQCQLCELEVSELGTDESLLVLKDIAADQDKYLETAISRALGNRNAMTNTWNNYDNAKIGQQLGQQNVYGGLNIH